MSSARFKLDAAYWEIARRSGTPELSDDVVDQAAGSTAPAKPFRHRRACCRSNLDADLGRNFPLSRRRRREPSGRRGETALGRRGLPRATGTIRTRDGRFDAYGQKLEIERGILNFQGLIDNPGLNIRAIRPNLPVEAGVEVTGTAKRPLVRLVSDPEVPDAEKLSWLVLGHGPDKQGGKDASVLLAAAQTILGGQDGGPLKAVQRSLGIDEFGISNVARLDGSGQLADQSYRQHGWLSAPVTRPPARSSASASGWRRMSLLSYDHSLSATSSVVKLTVDLSRNFSLVGRAGSDTGLDLLWNYRFGALARRSIGWPR
jgi:translocation and assembly module TamB